MNSHLAPKSRHFLIHILTRNRVPAPVVRQPDMSVSEAVCPNFSTRLHNPSLSEWEPPQPRSPGKGIRSTYELVLKMTETSKDVVSTAASDCRIPAAAAPMSPQTRSSWTGEVTPEMWVARVNRCRPCCKETSHNPGCPGSPGLGPWETMPDVCPAAVRSSRAAFRLASSILTICCPWRIYTGDTRRAGAR